MQIAASNGGDGCAVGLAWVGKLVYFTSTCWMASFYALEYVWTTLGWNLQVPL